MLHGCKYIFKNNLPLNHACSGALLAENNPEGGREGRVQV